MSKEMMVTNMTLKRGMELTVRGVLKPNAVRFGINVGDLSDRIALHFNPRLDSRTIVMNTMKDGAWQVEQREKDFPFEAGQEFEVTIVHNFDVFDIYLPNGNKIHFPNRLGSMQYKYIFFHGDARIQDIAVRPSLKPTKR